MRYVASSDRNVYDRCIYQGVDHEADAYFITGGRVPQPGCDGRVRHGAPRATNSGRSARRGARPDDKMINRSARTAIEVIKPFTSCG